MDGGGNAMVHDPRLIKFIILVYCYFMLGLFAYNRAAGYPPLLGESMRTVAVGNVVLVPLAILGLIRAFRKGRFLTFDRAAWILCSFGCYSVGAAVAFGLPRH